MVYDPKGNKEGRLEVAASKKDEFKPAYLIYGEESLLLEEALQRLKERLKSGDDNLDYDEFRATETKGGQIVDVARTVSFLSNKRLVVIKEAEQLSPPDITALVGYLGNPSSFTCLVLVAQSLKKTSKLFIAFNKKGAAYEYKPPFSNQYPAWIRNEFLARKKKISTDTANFIFLNVGKDLRKLRSEIEKICLFCKDKSEISLSDVEAVIAKSSQSGIFDLVDAIGRRNEKEAFTILNHLLETEKDYYRIFHMVVRQFRLLLTTRALLDKSATERELVSKVKLPSFIVKKYVAQAKNFSSRKLKEIYQYLLETDLSLKTSKKEPKLALEILFYKILADRE